MQTLKNKAFRVSVQWNALVRKPLSLERGGFTFLSLFKTHFLGDRGHFEITFSLNAHKIALLRNSLITSSFVFNLKKRF